MYRGRDEELRVYEAKKRFYAMRVEELEELRAKSAACARESEAERMREEVQLQEAELRQLRAEVIAARKQTEDRLKRLDRQLCEVLYLKYIKQLSVNEICGKLSYSMQRIYQLLNKGVDTYRTQFEQEQKKCL